MDRDTIIDGLRMTMDLCVFDPSTGEEIDPDMLNDINRATYDACKGALEILERLDTDSDTISRKAAIDAIEKVASLFPYKIHGKPETYDRYNEAWNDAIGRAELEINELPPAQPERIKGHWIEHDDGLTACECSVCHEKYALYEEDVFGRNFCPKCGAEMEVTE